MDAIHSRTSSSRRSKRLRHIRVRLVNGNAISRQLTRKSARAIQFELSKRIDRIAGQPSKQNALFRNILSCVRYDGGVVCPS
jgi:hypothetical protein